MSSAPHPSWIACCVLAGSGCAPELVEDAPLEGPYATQGGFLVDAHGGRLLLRGTNLSQ